MHWIDALAPDHSLYTRAAVPSCEHRISAHTAIAGHTPARTAALPEATCRGLGRRHSLEAQISNGRGKSNMIECTALAFQLDDPFISFPAKINIQRLKKPSAILCLNVGSNIGIRSPKHLRVCTIEARKILGRFRIDRQEMFVIHDDQFAQASRPPIVLTSEDRERLLSLKDAAMKEAPEVARFLLEELERADIVPPSAVIASPLVRMGSEVKFIDYATDRIEQVRLVYPEEADESRGWISVLTPIGSALLGLGPGQSIECYFAGGKTLRLGVLDIRQPSDGGLVRPSAASGPRSTGNGAAPYCSTVLANKELP